MLSLVTALRDALQKASPIERAELSAAIRGLLYEVEACPLLDILPGEVLTMVFNQLDVGELSGLVLVCKSFAAPVCAHRHHVLRVLWWRSEVEWSVL